MIPKKYARQKAESYARMFLENLECYHPENVSSIAYGNYDIGVCEYDMAMDCSDEQREALLASAEGA